MKLLCKAYANDDQIHGPTQLLKTKSLKTAVQDAVQWADTLKGNYVNITVDAYRSKHYLHANRWNLVRKNGQWQAI